MHFITLFVYITKPAQNTISTRRLNTANFEEFILNIIEYILTLHYYIWFAMLILGLRKYNIDWFNITGT